MHVICLVKRVMKDSCQHALGAECCSVMHQLSASTAGMELHNQVTPWCTGLIHLGFMSCLSPLGCGLWSQLWAATLGIPRHDC